MPNACDLEKLLELEQLLMDKFKPCLNVDPVARGSGYHSPMSELAKDKLRKERGQLIYVYNTANKKLLYVFDSKQSTYSFMKIHHKTLNRHLKDKLPYLNSFLFTLKPLCKPLELHTPLSHSLVQNLPLFASSLKAFLEMVDVKRKVYKAAFCSGQKVSAENVKTPALTRTFPSINKLASHLKGDKVTIRGYLKGGKIGLYRKQ